ncbi:MAG: carbohydrate ABC transporter permease [Chloroflexi bacterium]|nr:carbohydrate ABC transporter permease [Chloroflexota bacterium]
MVTGRRLGDRLVDVLLWSILALLAVLSLLPFLTVIARSLSSFVAVTTNQVSFWPIGFNVDNYVYLMRDNWFVNAFAVSVARVLAGVPLTLLLIVITAYPLSQDRLHMPGRTVFKIIMLVGLLFSGGLIPIYLAYKSLGLLNHFAVLVVPGALNIFLAIIIINFFRGLPQELSESAMLDGASHFDVLFRIFVPLSRPALATVALFSAVGHWNSWFDGIVFVSRQELWPLQSYLYVQVTTRNLNRMVEVERNQSRQAGVLDFAQATPEALQAAMIVLATVPIILVYPFLQRYFVTGLTLGSLKG